MKPDALGPGTAGDESVEPALLEVVCFGGNGGGTFHREEAVVVMPEGERKQSCYIM